MRSLLADEQVYAASLVGLAGMTPVRLARVLDGFRPAVAWSALQAGTHPSDPGRRFRPAARATDPAQVARKHAEVGVAVLLPDRPGYPAALAGDPGAPAVLFALGEPSRLEGRPSVAVVGTRSATPYGRRVASELGADLAAAGVVVVSGLARGIDAAAHAGALSTGPARHRLSLSSAPVSTTPTRPRAGRCGAGSLLPAPSFPKPRSGPRHSGASSRYATGSSRRSPMWWWSSSATGPGARSIRPRRRHAARSRCARYPVRSTARRP